MPEYREGLICIRNRFEDRKMADPVLYNLRSAKRTIILDWGNNRDLELIKWSGAEPCRLKPELVEWVQHSLKGNVWMLPHGVRCTLFFEKMEDAALFKLFHL